MIPVVNDRYRYILLYAPKVGCTSIRRIYLELHKAEMSDQELSSLDKYHNLNEVFPYDSDKDYSNYTTFILTRNPYSRIVSAFLDQYVFARKGGVERMLAKYGTGKEPENFLEFLQFLKMVPDSERDGHFQSQSYFPYTKKVVTKSDFRYRWLNVKPINSFGLKYVGDVSQLNHHLITIYTRIFKNEPSMLAAALDGIKKTQKRNSILYSKADYPDASLLSVNELDSLVLAPKPQDFFTNRKVVELVQEIYKKDFSLFSYNYSDLPFKQASKEIDSLPDDFDWQTYLHLNPDLSPEMFHNQRATIRHYFEFGRFETDLRAYKMEQPIGFDWERYINLHADLRAAGINTKDSALEHYLRYGLREKRTF